MSVRIELGLTSLQPRRLIETNQRAFFGYVLGRQTKIWLQQNFQDHRLLGLHIRCRALDWNSYISSRVIFNNQKEMVSELVEVVWLGHACFELKAKTKIVVIDPFKGIGLPEPKVKADLVLCSHGHFDHNNSEAVRKKDSVVLEGFVGSKEVDGLTVKGIATFHDDANGSARGQNSVHVIDVDGLRFCHLGDLGHDLTDSQVKEIGRVDVLLIPVGGHFTIDASTATKIMEKIKPRITVPMHYRVTGIDSRLTVLSEVDGFLRGKANVQRLDRPDFTVEKASLSKPVVIVLSLK